ncbi:MAG: hypothetical protein Q9222_001599 [Ikaeria aurantiellina]
MTVSHIGLTVSHLPTSCSFFLAALSPLGYRYIGQIGNQIGFGIDTAEFFISQETASVKAGAAHIVFSASSRDVVDAFFIAAFKAGGRIHGEPTERDRVTGYYSAAVLDFDGNSIEVMHRSKEDFASSRADHGAEDKRVLAWQKEVAKSTVSQDSQPKTVNPRIVVTSITKPTIMISSPATQSKSGNDMSSKAFIGTLLGAAAGAAVAYAMTKSEEGNDRALGNLAYQAAEATRSHVTPSLSGSQPSDVPGRSLHYLQREPREVGYPRSQLSIASPSVKSHQAPPSQHPTNRLTIAAPPPPPPPQASTLIDTFVSPSEVPRYRRGSLARSNTDGQLPSSEGNQIIYRISTRSKPPRSHSDGKAPSRADPVHSNRSSVITEVRHPREVPLPVSKANSQVSRVESDLRRLALASEHNNEGGTVLDSVAPSDSISQADSRRSKESKRSSTRSSRNGKHRELGAASQMSERTIRARDSKAGAGNGSIKSSPPKSSSRTSMRRSVVSFLPGM